MTACPCGSLITEAQDRQQANSMRNLLALQSLARRYVSTSARKQLKNKVSENQKIFQEDNGLPVHLKGGVGDNLLYRFSMTITVFGTCYALFWLFKASMPKQKK
ncbi:cytochrome c oxidase subunit 7A2, mitochondrial [Latimeria chalumnae]|uniref:Cytochrome c oxidase subunit 7A2 n=1 Tax=Latimeria chalumnae TaxID=7897 RepID=H3AAH4_LATCH|nr:PREDICTED: cytochrome c oxidase subunit 7A2, mitochondrial [Latimeria chalumnae]|eukprot:XP_005987851.1 PREDICTED: cytochrome c oxidase subunit 7A2, mitochondrial [Latimeria chalumnae]